MRRAERLPDVAVVVLATWTLVYHLCLVLRLGVAAAVVLEVLALAAVAAGRLVAHRRRAAVRHGARAAAPSPAAVRSSGAAPGPPAGPAERRLVAATVVTGGAAALLLAARGPWPLVAALWLAAAAAGTGVAVLRHRPVGHRLVGRHPVGHRPADDGPAAWGSGVGAALAWAGGLAVLSMFTRWPNPDDLYYVNLSQWVAERGTFPVRDTIFSDLAFPMSSWPPVASFDALVGVAARLAGVPAASVAYLVVPPVATFLSVLALWRLLRAWRVPAVALALSLALVFLLYDGGPGYAAPGNLFLIRLWQGKVVLLCLLVPTLLVHALHHVERPTRARALWLLAGGTAAVGLSTTAMFLVPLVAAAGAAPLLLRRRPGRALVGFAAMAGYPLAAGVLTLAVGGRSADDFDSRRRFRFDPAWFGHEIFRDGPIALVGVAAVLGGALLVRHRAAAVTTGLLALVTGVTFVPGVTRLSYELVGLGPTLWRVSWVASVAALVGVLGARLATSSERRLVRLGAPAALVAVLVVTGLPIFSRGNGVSLDATPQWKRGPESVATAEAVLATARPGDVVLAPEDVAITIAVLTTRVKTVAPRDYFMDYLREDPAFRYDDRLALVDFANGEPAAGPSPALAGALTALDVDHVCLPAELASRVAFVQEQGYRTTSFAAGDVCLTR